MKICFLSGLKEIVEEEEIEMDYTGKLSALLEALSGRYGEGFRALLFDSDTQEKRNPFVKILVDGEDIRQKDPVLTGSETIVFFLPIAGG